MCYHLGYKSSCGIVHADDPAHTPIVGPGQSFWTDVITRSKFARSTINVNERNDGQFSSGLWEPDDPDALLEGTVFLSTYVETKDIFSH